MNNATPAVGPDTAISPEVVKHVKAGIYICQDEKILSFITLADGYYNFQLKNSGVYSIYIITNDGKTYFENFSIEADSYSEHNIVVSGDNFNKNILQNFAFDGVKLASADFQSPPVQLLGLYRPLDGWDRFAYLFNWGNASDLNEDIKEYNDLVKKINSKLVDIPSYTDPEHYGIWVRYIETVSVYNNLKYELRENFRKRELLISESSVFLWKSYNKVMEFARKAVAKLFKGTWLESAMYWIDAGAEYWIDCVDDGDNIWEHAVKITGKELENYLARTAGIAGVLFQAGSRAIADKNPSAENLKDFHDQLEALYNEAKPIYKKLSFNDKKIYSELKSLTGWVENAAKIMEAAEYVIGGLNEILLEINIEKMVNRE